MKTKKILLVLVAVFAVILACAITAKILFMAKFEGPAVRVEIKKGATQQDVENAMISALGNFGKKTARFWKLIGGDPATAHGSYLVNVGDASLQTARRIAKGRQTPIRFTFNNLRTVEALATKVDVAFETDSASFMNATDNILHNEGLTRYQYPAAFLPDTYEFYWTASPETIVTKLYAVRNAFWTPERVKKARSLGLSPEDAHTLASIVEAETIKTDEHGKVGRLYLNRLEKNMLLQADPTVKFALGDPTIRRIRVAQILDMESPYNTYRNPGLPPGPISIPEAGTIDRVLNCEKHDYLFMCAKSDFSGYHNFSKDFATHKAYAMEYHYALDARGVK